MATYKPLEPSLQDAIGSTMSYDISSTSLSSAVVTIFMLMVSASLIAGLIRFAYAGFLYVKAMSPNQANEAKAVLQNAAYGIIGVLGMYLLIDQINPEMLGVNIGLKETKTEQTAPAGTSGGAGTTGATSAGNTTAANTSSNPDEAAARKKLIGVGVNNPAPTTIIAGLPDGAIDMVNDLKTYCQCSVVITGGTEPGHKTHGPGLNVVDLRCESGGAGCGNSDGLSNYIRKNGAVRTPRSFCYEDFYLNGFLFCNEKNSAVHWHVNEAKF